jgi:hypothetical protein
MLFLPIIFSLKTIGLNIFSARLWYVFEGQQSHHFLMVLQLAFQLNSFFNKIDSNIKMTYLTSTHKEPVHPDWIRQFLKSNFAISLSTPSQGYNTLKEEEAC